MRKVKYLDYGDEILTRWSQLKTSSYPGVTPAKGTFPLIFILHGRGSSKTNYTLLAEELCSHGYTVVVADHPGSGLTVLSDGTTKGLINPANLTYEATQMAEDIVFLRKKLFNDDFVSKLIDKSNVGVIGHSLGSMATLRSHQTAPILK